MINLINVVLGGALLAAGRKLFWLFIGALGFMIGVQLASSYWQGPEWQTIIVGLIAGSVFALLAIFLQTIAILVAGFLAGTYALPVLLTMLGIHPQAGATTWIMYIIGGLIGVALVNFLFDWALITLSSFAGASLIVNAFANQAGTAIFAILFFAGIIIQGSILRRERSLNRDQSDQG